MESLEKFVCWGAPWFLPFTKNY